MALPHKRLRNKIKSEWQFHLSHRSILHHFDHAKQRTCSLNLGQNSRIHPQVARCVNLEDRRKYFLKNLRKRAFTPRTMVSLSRPNNRSAPSTFQNVNLPFTEVYCQFLEVRLRTISALLSRSLFSSSTKVSYSLSQAAPTSLSASSSCFWTPKVLWYSVPLRPSRYWYF